MVRASREFARQPVLWPSPAVPENQSLQGNENRASIIARFLLEILYLAKSLEPPSWARTRVSGGRHERTQGTTEMERHFAFPDNSADNNDLHNLCSETARYTQSIPGLLSYRKDNLYLQGR